MPEITLPRRTATIADASDRVEGLARDAEWPEPDISRLVLAVTEAVSNAVEHGRGATLRLTVHWTDAGCRVTVSDGGSGPTQDEIDHATLPAPSATTGRGLYILAHLADDVSAEGDALRLTVRRRPAT